MLNSSTRAGDSGAERNDHRSGQTGPGQGTVVVLPQPPPLGDQGNRRATTAEKILYAPRYLAVTGHRQDRVERQRRKAATERDMEGGRERMSVDKGGGVGWITHGTGWML